METSSCYALPMKEKRWKPRIDPITGEEQKRKPRQLKEGRRSRDARKRWRGFTRKYFPRSGEFSWPFDHGAPPICVVSDPTGRIRVGVWKNIMIGENKVIYAAQISFLYWDREDKMLRAKWSINVREMFLVAKCLHQAIDWICKDARIPYPAELFDHARVGFEVRYEEDKRVIVSSEDQIKAVLEDYSKGHEEFNPGKWQMSNDLADYSKAMIKRRKDDDSDGQV